MKRSSMGCAILMLAIGCGGETGGSGGATGGAAGAGTGGSAGASAGGTGGASAGGTAGASSGGTAGASTGGSAGASTGGTAGASSGGTAGASTGGTAGSAGAGTCVEQTGGSGGFTPPTCADLDVMTVSNAKLDDAGGDGSISAGEAFTVTVDLNEVAGIGYNYYPLVAFESDTAGVTVSDGEQYFAILPCQTLESHGQGKVDASVVPGTVVTLVAKVATLNESCANTHFIEVPFTVQ